MITGAFEILDMTEDDQFIYKVRLGDSLRSIATKHPKLLDAQLWQLIAEMNSLSTETDSNGRPVEKLALGIDLMLPTAAQIEAFRSRDSASSAESFMIPPPPTEPNTD